MTKIARVAGFTACVFIAALTGARAAQAASATQCSALSRLKLPDVTSITATLVVATSTMPEYCNVQGNIGPGTNGFVVQLPTSWNGKLFHQGGGSHVGFKIGRASCRERG